jgi:hypothetical protein
VGLRFLARQGKRHDDKEMRSILVRSELDRTAGPFDRLIILFQCEMGARLVGIPCSSEGIIWTEPNRLVDRFDARLEFAESPHYEATTRH